MIASHIHNSGATLGMAQYATDHIGVALFPSQSILLYFPSVNDVPYQIQGFAGVVFEKIVELGGLAVSGT